MFVNIASINQLVKRLVDGDFEEINIAMIYQGILLAIDFDENGM